VGKVTGERREKEKGGGPHHQLEFEKEKGELLFLRAWSGDWEDV
jgi:hypothetical protein